MAKPGHSKNIKAATKYELQVYREKLQSIKLKYHVIV